AKYTAKNTPGESFPSQAEVDGARFEGDRLVVFKQFNDREGFAGTVCLKSDLGEWNERITRYGGIILLFTAASLLVTLFLSSRLQRIISRPIFHLAETAKAVS